MKNSKDKSIIKLLLVFLAYYLISFYLPDLFKNYGRLTNMIIKDIIMIIVVCLIYCKDVSRNYKSFKHSKNKWFIILWAIAIIAVWFFISYLTQKYFPQLHESSADINSINIEKYYSISKLYAFLKTVLFTGIIETILFHLSFRKVFNNDVIFIIVSALVYSYFNYLFTGFNFKYILNPLIIRFIPCVLYNIAYIKNNNNIVSLMGIIIVRNSISFALLLLG